MGHQALPQVYIMLEHPHQGLKMWAEFYTASWPSICEMVNLHNDEFVAGKQNTIMRVFCPWEGEELYIPPTTKAHQAPHSKEYA